MKTKVSIIKCHSYDEAEVTGSVSKAIELIGGISNFIKPSSTVLVKPNLLATKSRDSRVTTDPAVVGAVLGLIKDHGATPVVGDSPGIGSAEAAATKSGIMDEVKKHSAKFVELSTPINIANSKGKRFKKFVIAEEALEADFIINVPKLKTHAQMFLTMGIKNIFGCIPGKRKAQWHFSAGIDTSAFADMLIDLALLMKPALTVMDAVISMEGNGPASGDAKETGLIMASESPFSIDVVGCKVLGIHPKDLPVIKRALKAGIEESKEDNIEVVGERIEDVKISDFKFPPLVSPNFADKLPAPISKLLRNTLTSRPSIDTGKCMLCNVCVAACPTETITIENQSKIVIDYDGCIRCFCCQEMCPHRAIDITEGLLKRIIPGL